MNAQLIYQFIEDLDELNFEQSDSRKLPEGKLRLKQITDIIGELVKNEDDIKKKNALSTFHKKLTDYIDSPLIEIDKRALENDVRNLNSLLQDLSYNEKLSKEVGMSEIKDYNKEVIQSLRDLNNVLGKKLEQKRSAITNPFSKRSETFEALKELIKICEKEAQKAPPTPINLKQIVDFLRDPQAIENFLEIDAKYLKTKEQIFKTGLAEPTTIKLGTGQRNIKALQEIVDRCDTQLRKITAGRIFKSSQRPS